MGKLSALVVVLAVATSVQCLPLSKYCTLFITPDTIRHYASFVDDSLVIQDGLIGFNPGVSGEVLFSVPLAGPGELDCNSVIKITFAFDPDEATDGTDHDPTVGISDGETANRFYVRDSGSFSSDPPCEAIDATNHNNLISESNVAGQVTLTFSPFHRYGTCYTAQDGGFTDVGKFDQQLDLNKEVYLIVNRNNAPEVYRYYYFFIEIFQS